MLSIKQLTASINQIEVLKNIDLTMREQEIHILMGQNGSGKSSLAHVLMGHPAYQVIEGSITFQEQEITQLSPDKRSHAGMFLAAQYQHGIPGIQVFTFIKEALRALQGTQQDIDEIYDQMCDYMDLLGIDQSFAYRNVHDGFSGGEKKRFELLQLLMFKPKLAILDEIDSGLDLDGQKMVLEALALVKEQSPHTIFLVISHHPEFIKKIPMHTVHLMHQGTLKCSGDMQLVTQLETKGYDAFTHK